MDPEYAKLVGATRDQGKSAMPGPLDVGAKIWEHLKNPFYDNGPNDKGIGIQLAYSIARVTDRATCSRSLVAIPIGFLIGMSPLMNRALDPFIQVLQADLAARLDAARALHHQGFEPVVDLRDLHLLALADADQHRVRRRARCASEWLNVARTLEVGTFRRAFTIILPAAAPTILTGMRISIGIAWLVIVAAEMLVGGTGIGYFVWNEWNNLSITNVITAILVIGVVGMLLDQMLARATRLVTFRSERGNRLSAEGVIAGLDPAIHLPLCRKRMDARAPRSRLTGAGKSGRRPDDRQVHLDRRHHQALSGAGRRQHDRVRGSVAVDGARRVRLHHRPFRLRQDHRAQHPRRARRAVGGHRHRRQPGDRGAEPRPRRDLPEPRAAALAHASWATSPTRCRRNGAAWRRAEIDAPGAEIHRPRRPHRRRAQAAGRALRRHEAARRHRARALDRAEDHADGRAVLGARRAHARHAAGRGAAHLPRDRADRVHDHARRRRGDLSRRSRAC